MKTSASVLVLSLLMAAAGWILAIPGEVTLTMLSDPKNLAALAIIECGIALSWLGESPIKPRV